MPAPSRRLHRSDVTVLPATHLGGPPRLTGNFILTDLTTVRTPEFWEKHDIAVVVNCIGMRHGSQRVIYPSPAAKSLKLYVDTRNRQNRASEFAKTEGAVEEALEHGKNVLLHCRESFHRAPLICAAYLVRFCGVRHTVTY